MAIVCTCTLNITYKQNRWRRWINLYCVWNYQVAYSTDKVVILQFRFCSDTPAVGSYSRIFARLMCGATRNCMSVGRFIPPSRRLCNATRLFVCLSVCLWATLRRNYTERIFVKISPQMYLWRRKNWLNLGNYPLPNPDPGISWRILQYCEDWAFFTI